jgi:hypothetical protein
MDVMDVKYVKVSQACTTSFTGLRSSRIAHVMVDLQHWRKKRNTGWRRGYNSPEKQHFSKVNRIVEAVDDCTDLKAILEKFDAMYTEIRNVSKMIELLKKGGYSVVKSRKKKSHGGGDP